jgi:Rhodanese-like domain
MPPVSCSQAADEPIGYLLVAAGWRVAGPGLGIVMPTGIGRDELRALTGRGGQLVEVLPAGDFDWAHLPGAANIPLKELDAKAGQLDRTRPVIVYCHDWY